MNKTRLLGCVAAALLLSACATSKECNDRTSFTQTQHVETLEDAYKAYEKGDYKTAVHIFTKLAEQGSTEAQYNLGICYDNGQGVEQSYEEAVKWYTLAAEQGLAQAQYNLGYYYCNGQGVKQSYEEAAKWYTLAAEQGHVKAQRALKKLGY